MTRKEQIEALKRALEYIRDRYEMLFVEMNGKWRLGSTIIGPDHPLWIMINNPGAKEPCKTCRKCGGAMKPGQAFRNIATCGSLDMGEAVTFSEGTEAELIDCMKCEKCGWSVTVATEESGG